MPAPKRQSNKSTNTAANPGGSDMSKFLRPNCGANLVRPDWNKQQIPTIFRPLPGKKPGKKGPVLTEFRLSDDRRDYDCWYVAQPTVSFCGTSKDNKVSFIPYDASADPSTVDSNPYVVLQKAIRKAVKNKWEVDTQHGKKVDARVWATLFGGPNSNLDDVAFPQIKYSFFFNTLTATDREGKLVIDAQGRWRGLQPKDRPLIGMISQSLGNDWLGTQEKPGVLGTPGQKRAFKYGDVIDIAKGAFFIPANLKHHDITAILPGVKFNAPGEKDTAYYTPFVAREVTLGMGMKVKKYSADMSAFAEEIEARVLDLYDALYIPETEEICTYLARAFSSEPDLLYYGWAEMPQFFTDEVKGILNARKQGFIAGMTDEEEDDEEEEEEQSRRPLKKKKNKALAASDDDEDEPPFETDESPRSKKLKKTVGSLTSKTKSKTVKKSGT